MLRRFRQFMHHAWFRRSDHDAALDEELGFHLSQETALQMDRGQSREQAEQTARRAFGSTALVKETTRGIWGWPRLERLLQDLRQGARILRTAPGLSLTAIALVAVVIGGNTTVFSIVYSVLRKPATGVHASRLVTVHWTDSEGRTEPQVPYAVARDLARDVRSIQPLVGVKTLQMTLTHENGSASIRAGLVMPGFLHVLGTSVSPGRDLIAADHNGQSGLVVVISERLWRSQFGASPRAIGAAVLIDGHPATIVGVAEPGFRGALLALTSDAWMPLVAYSRLDGSEPSLDDRHGPTSLFLLGPLTPGTSVAQATADVAAIWTHVRGDLDAPLSQSRPGLLEYTATADGNSLVSLQGDRLLAVLTIVTAIVLIVVCANVSNLLVARAISRQRETALRQSLGAGPLRIARMLLAEGASIASLACAGAFALAWAVARAISGFVAPSTQGEQIVLPDFTPDWSVAAYAALLAMVAVLAVATAPILRSWQLPLLPLLRRGEAGVVPGRSRLSSVLVVLQLSLSVLLLTSAALAYRSLFLVDHRNLGFDTRDRLMVSVSTSGAAGDEAAHRRLVSQMLRRIERIPDVVAAAASRRPPLSGWMPAALHLEDGRTILAERNLVTERFLDTLDVPVAFGHQLDMAPGSALVNEDLAARLWPDSTAIGRELRFGKSDLRATVVGVIPNVVMTTLRGSDRPTYVLMNIDREPAEPGEVTFTIRYQEGTLERVGPAVRRALREEAPTAPIVFMRTMEDQRAAETWPVRFIARLLVVFALLALAIAAIGQYGAVAFDMRRRVRELGLRMALGASARQLTRSIVVEGLRATVIGLLIGFALSAAAGRVLGSVLYGVTPTDPVTYAGVLIVLGAASLAACYIPARRATRIDPLITLREN